VRLLDVRPLPSGSGRHPLHSQSAQIARSSRSLCSFREAIARRPGRHRQRSRRAGSPSGRRCPRWRGRGSGPDRAREGLALRGALDLDEPARPSSHVEVDVRRGVLLVGRIEHRLAVDDRDAHGRHRSVRTSSRAGPRSPTDRMASASAIPRGDRRAPGAGVGEDTSQSIVTVRSPSFDRSVTPRSARPIRRWISCVRPRTSAFTSRRCAPASSAGASSTPRDPSLPVPRSHRADSSSTDAATSTRVAPGGTGWSLGPILIPSSYAIDGARPPAPSGHRSRSHSRVSLGRELDRTVPFLARLSERDLAIQGRPDVREHESPPCRACVVRRLTRDMWNGSRSSRSCQVASASRSRHPSEGLDVVVGPLSPV